MSKQKADLDDGYTRIANSLLEALYKTPILSRESRVLLFIIRQTYGFGHKSRELSNGFIAAGTGIDIKSVSKIVKGLVSANVIEKEQAQGRKPQIMGINTQIQKWTTIPKSDGNTTVKSTVHKSDGNTIPKSDGNTTVKSDPQLKKDINKDIKVCGGTSSPATHFPIFDRLAGEWKYSHANLDRVTKRQRAEVEEIGYPRMNDARLRYEAWFEDLETKNNQYLSARTWFSGAYRDYLPAVDENGIWYNINGQKCKGERVYE
jgi:phage replication O-like protein O